MGLRIQ
ncbi:hypothetical protein HU200_010167 [Digitaria exilis]|nr:hypothetical protein HU200_018649 [Digitaria exilis]KAF8760446.1 hypothetical protein HU200_010167 [Digitaria exilis]